MTEEEVVQVANALTRSGRQREAKVLLLSIHPDAADWVASPRGFDALLLLARCYRAEHDFDQARKVIGTAIHWAQSAGATSALALALEGAALVEREDGRIQTAGEFFTASARAEASIGNNAGRAAALSNYANMLTGHDIEGGEQLLREALRCAEPGSHGYFTYSDNLAGELHRQGRYDEAVPYGETAVNGFTEEGSSYDAFLALLTLARNLARAGRHEESASAFTRAHDIIRDLRLSEGDDQHYALYPERTKEIEDNSREAVKDSPVLHSKGFLEILRAAPEGTDPAALFIGIHAIRAQEAQDKGFVLYETGQYSAAIDSLLVALQSWEAIQAVHMIVTIKYHLALVLTDIGDTEKARPLLFDSFRVAHNLGDAFREGMALSLLGRIADGAGGRDRLDYFMSALALAQYTRRQLGWTAGEDRPTDGGVLYVQIANTCTREGAYDLAETYYEKTLQIARELPGQFGHRYVYRLANFLEMLRLSGRHDQAATVLAELRAAAANVADDPRVDRILAAEATRVSYSSGAWTQETLDGLLSECRAYEQGRSRAHGLDLTGFAAANEAPYQRAAQVALTLGDSTLALGLLERGAAQTLLEALAGGAPDEHADFTALPSIGSAVGVTLFPHERGITLLALDGTDGSITQSAVAESAGNPLLEKLQDFTDSADSERRSPADPDALAPVLDHPTFQRLGAAVASLIPAGRKAWLVPHGYLHNAPLHLLPPRVYRYAIMPSLAIAAALPPSRSLPGYSLPGAEPQAPARGIVIACGDSLGDLPFARAETRLIAGQEGTAALGGDCTAEWLQAAAATSASVLHVACHGRFDGAQPSRSGLVLAAPPDGQLAGTSTTRLLTLPEVARLPLRGMTVVLSACSSGMEAVRVSEPTGLVSAMLSAGAATVIAAQWPIADLSAMLLMTRFYHRLRLAGQTPPADVLAALDAAAGDVRDMTVTGLVQYGFELTDQLIALGGSAHEACLVAGGCLRHALTATGDDVSAGVVTAILAGETGNGGLAALQALRPPPSSGSATRPFADAAHWGAFKIVGRSSEGIHL